MPATKETSSSNVRRMVQLVIIALVLGFALGFLIGVITPPEPTAANINERILIASAIETGEMVRSALRVYAAKSPENSFPGILELHNHETLQSIVNAHGGNLKELSESNVRFLFYEPYYESYSLSDDEKPGVNYAYVLHLAIKDIPDTQLYVSPWNPIIAGKPQR